MYLQSVQHAAQIGSCGRRQERPTSDAWCASKLFSVRHELWELKDERDHRPAATVRASRRRLRKKSTPITPASAVSTDTYACAEKERVSSHVTLCWREEDSNCRSLSQRVVSPTEREMPRERKGESRQRQLSFGAPNVGTRLPPPARLTRVTEHSLRRLLKDFELFGFAVRNSKFSPYNVCRFTSGMK